MQFQKFNFLSLRMLNSVCLSLFLDVFHHPPPPDSRWPFVNKMSAHIYTTYVSGILGQVGGGAGRGRGRDRVVDAKEDNFQLKTLSSWRQKISFEIYRGSNCTHI